MFRWLQRWAPPLLNINVCNIIFLLRVMNRKKKKDLNCKKLYANFTFLTQLTNCTNFCQNPCSRSCSTKVWQQYPDYKELWYSKMLTGIKFKRIKLHHSFTLNGLISQCQCKSFSVYFDFFSLTSYSSFYASFKHFDMHLFMHPQQICLLDTSVFSLRQRFVY